ncbi:MAG: ankyrin repeat domain-containing protein, partial [Planctomycetaceae bacterium]
MRSTRQSTILATGFGGSVQISMSAPWPICSPSRWIGLLLLAGGLCCSVAGGSSAWADSPSVIRTALADAVERMDSAVVGRLLDGNVDVNAAQVDGMTALHWAVYQDDLATVRMLLKAGADARAKNRYAVAPLSLACTNGNADIVSSLLDAGADPNTTLRGGETALMTAARTGRLGPVKMLIDRRAKVDARERHGQTALMWAAAEGHVEVVEALLAADADFATPLKSGFTPYFFAVREGKRDVVDALLKAGVDVNSVMAPPRASGKRPQRGTSGLTLAVENGHFALAVALLQHGADPNDQRSGFSALHILTWVRKPNRGDGADGDPPPRGSGRLNSLQMVRALVAHGADVNLRLKRGKSGRGRLNQKGATPFLLACKTADLRLLQLLLELGAHAQLGNGDQCTPLMAASGIGTLAPGEEAGTEAEAVQVIRLLLKLGADVNAVDKNGETAMHGAAYKSLPDVVRILADNGAKISIWNRENTYGWTPLRIAEGHRPGNFKPSFETVDALRRVMIAAGVTPPKSSGPREQEKRYRKPGSATPPEKKRRI